MAIKKEGEITFDIIKESLYENNMCLMLSWCRGICFTIVILYKNMKYT